MLKLNIAGTGGDKGRTFHLEADEKVFVGMKIGDSVQGKDISKDFDGYEFAIAGASDKAGFPALKGIEGVGLRRVLLKYGKGMRESRPKGMRKRKSVRGNTLSADIAQINLIVKKQGETALSKIFPEQCKKEEEAKSEEAKAPEAAA
jgi:small subunit ribosomal protein S6e